MTQPLTATLRRGKSPRCRCRKRTNETPLTCRRSKRMLRRGEPRSTSYRAHDGRATAGDGRRACALAALIEIVDSDRPEAALRTLVRHLDLALSSIDAVMSDDFTISLGVQGLARCVAAVGRVLIPAAEYAPEHPVVHTRPQRCRRSRSGDLDRNRTRLGMRPPRSSSRVGCWPVRPPSTSPAPVRYSVRSAVAVRRRAAQPAGIMAAATARATPARPSRISSRPRKTAMSAGGRLVPAAWPMTGMT